MSDTPLRPEGTACSFSPLFPHTTTVPSPSRATLCPQPPETATTPTSPTGTSACPQASAPHAVTRPVPSTAKLNPFAAATVAILLRPATTDDWLPCNDTTLPSSLNARAWEKPPATSTTLLNPTGKVNPKGRMV